MLNQLLRFTLVSGALLWLKPRWRGLLALIIFVLLVHVLHGEFLGYVELSGNSDFLVWSYLVKWLALTAGVIAYFFFAVMRSGTATRQTAAPASKAARDDSAAEAQAGEDDGFDFLRRKKQLETRAEKILGADRRD